MPAPPHPPAPPPHAAWRALLRAAVRFDEPEFLAHQVALVQRYLPIALPASAFVAVIIAAVHYVLAGDAAIGLWAAVTVAVSFTGLALGRRQVAPALSPDDARGQARRTWVLALLIGVAWGALPWGFMITPQPHTTSLVVGALAGLNAGGMVVFSPLLPLSIVYLLATVPPAGLLLLASPHLHDQVMGVATFTYLLVMLGFAWQSARAVRESIALRHANTSLIERLRDQTLRAFEARQVAEEALQEAEAANRAKDVFLASTSHDLRQPLHALGLFVNALDATDLTTRQRALLKQVDVSAQAARDMLGTLLDFSKVDAGVVTPRPQPFELAPLLARLQAEFGVQARAAGLSLRVRPTGAVAVADPVLVERILRNLLGNALRYTERGGVLVGCRRRGDRVVVEVWDTGLGIPKHQQQAVFREFHQLGNPERDRRKGLGLGLAIVDGLARAMSVAVTVASVPGRGSVFRLTLALARQAVLAAPEEAPPAGTDLAGARVLVVDDDEGVRVAMAELLTAWGAWVEVAESAQEACALLCRFTPDVLVADYRLRGHATGRDAVALIRQAVGHEVPAVLVTGDTAADRLRDAQAAGVALLHKPVPAQQLLGVLSGLLDRPALRDAAPPSGADDAPVSGRGDAASVPGSNELRDDTVVEPCPAGLPAI